MYQASVREVVEASAGKVRDTYLQAQIAFPDALTRKLEEVEAFQT